MAFPNRTAPPAQENPLDKRKREQLSSARQTVYGQHGAPPAPSAPPPSTAAPGGPSAPATGAVPTDDPNAGMASGQGEVTCPECGCHFMPDEAQEGEQPPMDAHPASAPPEQAPPNGLQ